MKRAIFVGIALLVAASSCRFLQPQTASAVGVGMERVNGEFTYTNEFVLETYYVEHAVALLDMTGFILRDREWELPVESQVLGYMEVDEDSNSGSFSLQLPVRPAGEMHDLDNNDAKDPGVKVFTVGYSPNLTGGIFSEGDDRSLGWPSYLASVKVDSENQDEVIGGRLIVWAADDLQQFPTGFGPDGLLFTEDDPAGSLPAGYSLIDLDTKPFKVSQPVEATMSLYEPDDVALKDLSNLSFINAFDRMFEIVRKEYAFNGIVGKQPEWDRLYQEFSPRVQDTDRKKDLDAFDRLIEEFSLAFEDGHVGMNSQKSSMRFDQRISGGYGFAIRELTNGQVIVIYVGEGGPAETAGIQVGARVTEFNNVPIGEAIGNVAPASPQSTDFGLRYQQARYLLRGEPGTKASVTFTNPGGPSDTVELSAVEERLSFSVTSLYWNYDPNTLPIEYNILPSGLGYIRINSNYDDLGLAIRVFERALKIFTDNQLEGVIIDMRINSGGAPLGLAGFLYDQEIPLGQLEYYSEKSAQFEPNGPPDKVFPNLNQYRFDKMALLVDQACYSACEIEAYGFSQVPGMIVVGQYPTGGVEAEVARGQFLLPGGIELQIPTGRFTLPDGSIFLEGVGVQPTLRVPVDISTVFSEGDVVLAAAEDALLGN